MCTAMTGKIKINNKNAHTQRSANRIKCFKQNDFFYL